MIHIQCGFAEGLTLFSATCVLFEAESLLGCLGWSSMLEQQV